MNRRVHPGTIVSFVVIVLFILSVVFVVFIVFVVFLAHPFDFTILRHVESALKDRAFLTTFGL